MIVTSLDRDIGDTCGAVAPIMNADASTTASTTGWYATTAKTASIAEFSIADSSSTGRCPQRSAAAPRNGPTRAVPTPTAAEVSPPSESDPRTVTTIVSTPTTIIANGRRAMNAMTK